MRVAFLIGAGVSGIAGMPTTKCLTERILASVRITRQSDGTYYEREAEQVPVGGDDYVAAIRELLGALKERIDHYLERHDRQANCEDLYYVADQIYSSEAGELDLPFVGRSLSTTLRQIGDVNYGAFGRSDVLSWAG